jgi:hypothetical protein
MITCSASTDFAKVARYNWHVHSPSLGNSSAEFSISNATRLPAALPLTLPGLSAATGSRKPADQSGTETAVAAGGCLLQCCRGSPLRSAPVETGGCLDRVWGPSVLPSSPAAMQVLSTNITYHHTYVAGNMWDVRCRLRLQYIGSAYVVYASCCSAMHRNLTAVPGIYLHHRPSMTCASNLLLLSPAGTHAGPTSRTGPALVPSLSPS